MKSDNLIIYVFLAVGIIYGVLIGAIAFKDFEISSGSSDTISTISGSIEAIVAVVLAVVAFNWKNQANWNRKQDLEMDLKAYFHELNEVEEYLRTLIKCGSYGKEGTRLTKEVREIQAHRLLSCWKNIKSLIQKSYSYDNYENVIGQITSIDTQVVICYGTLLMEDDEFSNSINSIGWKFPLHGIKKLLQKSGN